MSDLHIITEQLRQLSRYTNRLAEELAVLTKEEFPLKQVVWLADARAEHWLMIICLSLSSLLLGWVVAGRIGWGCWRKELILYACLVVISSAAIFLFITLAHPVSFLVQAIEWTMLSLWFSSVIVVLQRMSRYPIVKRVERGGHRDEYDPESERGEK
jgi:hypothetical protein